MLVSFASESTKGGAPKLRQGEKSRCRTFEASNGLRMRVPITGTDEVVGVRCETGAIGAGIRKNARISNTVDLVEAAPRGITALWFIQTMGN